MHEHYAYQIVTIAPRTWADVSARIMRAPGGLESAGGRLFGLWQPQIGMPSTEGIVVSVWPDAARHDAATPALESIQGVLGVRTERLIATVRPLDPTPPPEGGVYAHRWFDLAEKDWPEFLSLSEGAWPGFESAFDARIVGFWRSLDVASAAARVLLMTRYGSLAVWERSRRPPEAGRAEPWRRFGRRHELTASTVVITAQLIRPGE